MRTQTALYITFLVCNAIPSAAVVTIAEDSGKKIMRRENKNVVEAPGDSHVVEARGDGTLHLGALTEGEGYHVTSPNNVPTQTCNDDFPLGVNNTNSCVNTTHHKLILDESMCMKAAQLASAGIEPNFFSLELKYGDLHPQGCFAWHCGQTHNRSGNNFTECYYYNPNGDEPTNPHGPPVCFRADFLNGTKDTNGGCDNNYDNVMDETLCMEAAECLGFNTEAEFRVGEWNFSKHNEYPKGCFIRTDTGAFQFNNISSLSGEPTHPEIGGGIPVCNVTSKIHWPESLATPAPSVVLSGNGTN